MKLVHSKSLTTTLFAMVAFAFVAAQSLEAQSSTTRGFVLGAHLGAAAVSVDGSDSSTGGGGGLLFGLGLNRNFTVYLQLDAATLDVENGETAGNWTLGHADLGLRFHFANSLRSWVPYVQGGFSGRAVSLSDIPAGNPLSGREVSISGTSLTFGGGVMIYPSQAFAVDLSVAVNGGQFTTLTVDNTSQTGFDIDSTSTRINVGFAWWP